MTTEKELKKRPKKASKVKLRRLRKYTPRGKYKKAPKAKVIDEPKALKVGIKYGLKALNYFDVPLDFEGYADPDKFLPLEYDLVHAEVINSLGQRFLINIWHALGHWDGLRWKASYKVLRWKRMDHPYEHDRKK